ncbi:NF038122 family metalloprotease [Humisphaera borealis]|uniref:PEP-CTERM sorting domain-containing protein n=1 Tax=Humisphaera borealis TaxID=2807512 RepID=A0A7M2X087_9BACT|nr:NF038122 family metalloprotease [Humisphaera borealis]QOV90501.1 PEP-CTERM sorting domain-containing protein [Humisphaera borealis]
MFRRMFHAAVALGALGLCVKPASAELIFNITNDGAATPQMMAGFAEAGAMWSARFNDPITVNIHINAVSLPPGGIGHTETFYDPYSYTAVRNAMLADKKTADDNASSSNLQAGAAFAMLINRTANNPNGVVSTTPYFDTGLGGAGQAGPENNSTIRMSSANAKALGLYPAHGTGPDGIITFGNAVAFDFDRSDGITAGQVDFVGAAAHEIGHMLGFVSGVDILAGNGAAPGLNDNQLKFVTPLDLFRFSSRSIGTGGGIGVIDWTADGTRKYFSVNGGTSSIADFSTGAIYEESHWKNGLGIGIMDPTAGAGNLLPFTTIDQRAFDVIGYDRVVPEPSTAAALGAVGLLWSAGRRRQSAATRRLSYSLGREPQVIIDIKGEP